MSHGEIGNQNITFRVFIGDKSIYKTKVVKAFNIKSNAICVLVKLSEYCVNRIVKTIRI
jgi:hypothetical protein